MNNKKYMKRLYTLREFSCLLEDLISSVGNTRKLTQNERIGKQFQERIMMAVTEVNGCRYCSFFHTRVALQSGINRSEIDHLLAGDFQDAPEEELPALFFAQHYAESGGNPDENALRCLQEHYGAPRSAAILANIRAIMVGNAWGNMFDSLRGRLLGKAHPQVRLADELGVLFGPLFIIPAILFRKILNGR